MKKKTKRIIGWSLVGLFVVGLIIGMGTLSTWWIPLVSVGSVAVCFGFSFLLAWLLTSD
jgi:hypothetical protein